MVYDDHEEIIAIKKYIIDYLPSLSIEYKYALDYIHNHKNTKYCEMLMNRTNLSERELYEKSSSLIADVNKWIYDQLLSYTSSKRAMLLCDEKVLMKFIDKLNEFIRSNTNEIFIHRA